MAAPTRQMCPRGHEMPPLSSILKAFSLDEKSVLDVWIVGSHVWGTCTKHSDWDMVIILNSHPTPINAHKNKMDAWILSSNDYQSYIKEHLIQALITIWLPEPFALKRTSDPKTYFNLSQPLLAASVEKMYERDMRVALKHHAKNDINGSIKVLRHCLRQMCLSLQIYNHLCILDYTVISQEEETLKMRECDKEVSWEELVSIVKPRMSAILEELKSFNN